MANVIGTGTVFNLPNFAGQLYSATPAVTPFLNLIRGNAVKKAAQLLQSYLKI